MELPDWIDEAQELCELAQALPGWTAEELDALPARKSDAVRLVGKVNRKVEAEHAAGLIVKGLRG